MKLSGEPFLRERGKNFKLNLVLVLIHKSKAHYFSTVKSVRQVPGSFGVGANGGKARVIPAMGA